MATLITPAACKQLLQQLASATSLDVIEARQQELGETMAAFVLTRLGASDLEWGAFFADTRSLHVAAVCNSLRLVVAAGASASSQLPAALSGKLVAVASLLQAHQQRVAAIETRDPAADEAANLTPLFVASGAPELLAQTAGLLAETLRDRQGDEAFGNHWGLAAHVLAWSTSETGVFPVTEHPLQPRSASAQLRFIPIAALAVLQLRRTAAELEARRSSSQAQAGSIVDTFSDMLQTRDAAVSDVVLIAIEMARALDAAGPSRGKMLVPQQVLDSPDVTLLLMAFGGLAVQHCYRLWPAAAAGVPADHELLLRALPGLSGLTAVGERAVGRLWERMGDMELRLAADAATFAHHYKLNASRVAMQNGSPTAEPALDVPAGTPAPLLLTIIEAAQLTSKPEVLAGLIAFTGGHLTAAAMAQAAGSATQQRQVAEAVLLRLAPVVQRALMAQSGSRDAEAAVTARTLQGTYAALIDAGGEVLVGTVFAAAAACNAAVFEAGIRAFHQQRQQLPEVFARLQVPDRPYHSMLPCRRSLLGLAVRVQEPRLNTVVAADPAAARALFSLLATMLKGIQLMQEDSSALILALREASTASMIAGCASFTDYDPLNPAWDPASMRTGAVWLPGAGSSSGSASGSHSGSSSSSSSSSSASDPDALLWVALMGRALRCMGRSYQQLHAAGLSAAAGSEAVKNMLFHCPALTGVVHWLGGALEQLQLPGEPALAASALAQLQQQQAQLQALLDLRKAQRLAHELVCGHHTRAPALLALLQDTISAETAGLACELGASVCAALPVPAWCNNPDCTNLGRLSEAQLVGRRFCSSCVTAKYCSTACQHAHWKAQEGLQAPEHVQGRLSVRGGGRPVRAGPEDSRKHRHGGWLLCGVRRASC